jgi:hypothetical protein
MNYQVGQVIYVLLNKEATVYPMLVVEEITKKTLEGEVNLYMVRAGADPEKVLAIGEIDGEVFDSADRAKAILLERVTDTINARVGEAVEKAKEWYPQGRELPSDDPMAIIKKTMTVSEQAEARKPVPKQKPQAQIKPELAATAAELQAESDAVAMIELPNGQKARIKSLKLPGELDS